MIRPVELQREYPIKLSGGVYSTTLKVWEILRASHNGDLKTVKQLAQDCPALAYAQYNYTPPVYFAVREGHRDLLAFLLEQSAHAPGYKNYPFQESLQTIAADRGFDDIVLSLDEYAGDPSKQKYKGDNGETDYGRTELQLEFEKAVDKEDLTRTKEILQTNPEFALDPTYFWSEGILLFAAKEYCIPMMELLMQYGAKVPDILKWCQYYYFERSDSAAWLLRHGMNPNTRSWHNVTILHDMAQKGFIDRAEMLIAHGADINAIDEEYLSTPLGMAARWGKKEMVEFLLSHGADHTRSGAAWSTPLAWSRKKDYPEIERILIDKGAKS